MLSIRSWAGPDDILARQIVLPCFLNGRGQIRAPRRQAGRTNAGAEPKPRAQVLGRKPCAAVLMTMLPRHFRCN